MCASTMQNYHMAQILLLTNKPHESTARKTTVTQRLRSYSLIANKLDIMHAKSAEYHCRGLKILHTSIRFNLSSSLDNASQKPKKEHWCWSCSGGSKVI